MNWKRRISLFVAAFAVTLFNATSGTLPDSAHAKKLFRNPPPEYSTGPLWVWNDMLTDEQIRSTLRDLAQQKVKQVWVHPRPGLMTPYLSDQWFHLWEVTLAEAKRLDMNVWIYDENSYPSGFAGGWVPELMPESRGRGLGLRESKTPPKWSENMIAVHQINGEQTANVTTKIKSGETLPEARYLIASLLRAEDRPWTANRSYVDLLYPGVTEKFLEVTLEPYRQRFGKEFGKRIPGSFTDEPELRPAGGLPWTADLPQQFQKRWGYDLVESLPSLAAEIGDWKRVRHNYYQTLNDLFIERWAKPYFEYCAKHNLEFTGHYWEHEWPRCGTVPDNMAMAAWQQRPGIDILMNRYEETTHAQFGNLRACREVSSLANQFGRRTLVEIYGAAGWDLRFEDMKRIGDWLEVLGVNTLNQHLSYVTIRGARKRDHPQSFSYHEPWWEAYHVSVQYFARLSAALCQGEQINRVLVLEPTTTAWMYQGHDAKLAELGDSFFKLLLALEAAQVEYDLGCEDVIAREGSRNGQELKIGNRSYRTVIIPPFTDNLNAKTTALLDGVTRVYLGHLPERNEGQLTKPVVGSVPLSAADISRRINLVIGQESKKQKEAGFHIERTPGDNGILFHHRRQLADGQLLFLVNTSAEQSSSGLVLLPESQTPERWDLYTGEITPFPFARVDRAHSVKLDLPPSGSLLLWLGEKKSNREFPHESVSVIRPERPPQIRRLEPNVLTLDYVDITAGGETRTNVYFYEAQQLAFKQNGMDRNPWDSAVQFKDELITRKFAPDSGFTASYRFSIATAVPKNLAIVIERPDMYTITCNGQPVKARSDDWWLDKSFGRIALSGAARVGENSVTLQASPFTIYHELEPAYVLGDFTLKPVERGFLIAPYEPLELKASTTTQSLTHSINPAGTMWLSGGIGANNGTEDRAPFIVFDLGRDQDLAALRIWNYCEANIRDLTSRGAKEIRLSAASDNQATVFDRLLGTFTLKRGNARGGAPETLTVDAKGVRFVRLEILSRQDGVKFPATGEPEDNGYVGLAEVQFLPVGETKIGEAKVHQSSSELPSHQRLAKYLVDGSGLTSTKTGGWDSQGHPFYSAGVAYEESFHVTKPVGRYQVALSEWLGSVAKVSVNGKSAGYIDAPPWECDVTRSIKRGNNSIEVTVIGTLKNTLGPHHGNPALGAAWPSQFHVGPKTGPPPGELYSTVGYGLFEPFVLKQVK